MHVPHREFASHSPSGRTVIISLPDDTFEVVDLLLDMRSAAVSDAELAALIDSEAQPAH